MKGSPKSLLAHIFKSRNQRATSPTTTVAPTLTVKGVRPNSASSQAYCTDKIESGAKEYGKITIHHYYPDLKIRIGNGMRTSMKEHMVHFLSDHLHNFTWRTEDMRGVSLDITEHKLNIDPTF